MLVYVINVITDTQEALILKHVKVVMLIIVFHAKLVRLIHANCVNKDIKAIIVHLNV